MWFAALPNRVRSAAESLWMIAAAGGASSPPPVELLWVGQGVTLAVALATGWFALRSKRTEVGDNRQARFEKRIDEELDDQRALTRQWQEAWTTEHQQRLRYEGYLIRHGINPETGRREADDV
ncbi:hypothetical protein GCM10022379_19080 [Micromonospora maritima]